MCFEASLVLVMTLVVKYSYLFQDMTLAVYLRVLIIVAILCTGHGVIFLREGGCLWSVFAISNSRWHCTAIQIYPSSSDDHGKYYLRFN